MRKGSHTQYDIEYHIVWTTRYRYKVLRGKIAERLREIIRQSCAKRGITIIRGSIGKEHVHLWSPGYFCRSVGNVTKEIIKEYIENQTEEEDNIFKILG